MRHRQGITALLLAAATLLAQEQEVRNPHTSPEDAAAGARIFRSHCAECHGLDARGGRGPDLTRGMFRHGDSDAALLRTISRGIPGSEMPGIFFSDNQLWQVVTYIRTLNRNTGDVDLPGDAARGEELFRQKGDCLRCHMVNGEGGRLGPALSEVGWRRSPEHLKTSILRPGDDVLDRYWLVRVVDKQGRVIQGIPLNEDTYSIRLMDLQENLHSLWKRDLREIQREKTSAMPAYQGLLSEQELDDLVAYLYSLRAKTE